MYPERMTSAPDSIDALRSHLDRALALLEKMRPGYETAREFYDGTRAEQALTTSARAIIDQSRQTPIALAHIPVDVVAEKVELSAITAAGAAARQALETWADANDIDDEALDWIRKACYFGDYYAVTDPTGLDEDDAVRLEDIESVGLSPLSTIMVYDRKTGRRREYGLHVWASGTKDQPLTRGILYYDDASVRVVADGTDITDGEKFRLDVPELVGEGASARPGEDDDAYIEHEGDRMLLHHLAIGGKPYGTPLHVKAYGPQDAITKISANNLVNVEALGLPSRWALVDPAAEIDDDLDDDFGTDGPGVSAARADGRTTATSGKRTRVVPGAVEYLRGVKETGTYEGASADPFLANMEFYMRLMAVATGVALHEFDLKGEQPSGEARRRAEGRSNRTAARVKRQAGAFFRDIADTVLGLIGLEDEVTVAFNPSETSTDKDGLELVASKVKTGVPLRQALLEAGYTAEQVEEWYPEGAPAISPALMLDIADALAKLGNAKTLGAITDEGIAAMIPELFRYVAVATAEGVPADEDFGNPSDSIVTDAVATKAAADALGVLIRSGVDQEEAAARVGLAGLTFPNLPTTIRVPETDAAGIEQA